MQKDVYLYIFVSFSYHVKIKCHAYWFMPLCHFYVNCEHTLFQLGQLYKVQAFFFFSKENEPVSDKDFLQEVWLP